MSENLYWDGYRYWNGDQPVPKSVEEAREMGLDYDPATDSYWRGEIRIATRNAVRRTEAIHANGMASLDTEYPEDRFV